ncbi:hypothetical protein ACKKBF_B02650 [Auxenochlorella protothecoides x Auxenochlorella symbiontica]
MLLGSLAIATAGNKSNNNDDSESMEGKEEYKSGWYPDDWQRHYWCQKYFGSWKFCYYWWWYNGRYYYRRCSWNNCKGEKVKPYH